MVVLEKIEKSPFDGRAVLKKFEDGNEYFGECIGYLTPYFRMVFEDDDIEECVRLSMLQ
jgi:hypothetical protein